MKKQGFTLIELLIVILIIAVLSGVMLSVINSSGLKAKSRDGQRNSDLHKVQTALELYYADNRKYPTAASWANISSALSSLVSDYISVLPSDPSAFTGTNPCSASTFGYLYKTDSNGYIYALVSTMEVDTSDDSSRCDALGNWGNLGCGATTTCYGLQNP